MHTYQRGLESIEPLPLQMLGACDDRLPYCVDVAHRLSEIRNLVAGVLGQLFLLRLARIDPVSRLVPLIFFLFDVFIVGWRVRARISTRSQSCAWACAVVRSLTIV